MLPVVRGDRETVKQIVLYSFVLVGVTVVPFFCGTLGLAYLVAALVLGAGFIWLAVAARPPHDAAPRVAPLPLRRSSTWRCSSSRRPSDVGRLMLDPETERKNMLWGWGLFVLFCLIAAGTVAVAFIYLAVD